MLKPSTVPSSARMSTDLIEEQVDRPPLRFIQVEERGSVASGDDERVLWRYGVTIKKALVTRASSTFKRSACATERYTRSNKRLVVQI